MTMTPETATEASTEESVDAAAAVAATRRPEALDTSHEVQVQRRSTEELRAIAEQGAAELGEYAGPEEVISWVARTFPTRMVAVASSMADSVVAALVSDAVPTVDVVFLDTGYHFPETLQTRDAVRRQLPVTVVNVEPEQTVAEQDASEGPRLYERDSGRCCSLRKVTPLRTTLKGYEVWLSGVRRDEAPTRAHTPLVAFDDTNGLVKVSPLATWTEEQVNAVADARSLPSNPLLTQGYPSIGCEPCTRPVAEGEDPRSGRWAGQEKTECGLHWDTRLTSQLPQI